MKITSKYKMPASHTPERSICEFLAASTAPHIFAVHHVRWTDMTNKTHGIDEFDSMVEFESPTGHLERLRSAFDSIRFDYIKVR